MAKSHNFPYYWNSNIHVALLYGKMTNEPFTVDDLYAFSPNFSAGGNRFRVVNNLNRATKNGDLIRPTFKSWRITRQGIDTVHGMASLHRRNYPLTEEDLAELSLA